MARATAHAPVVLALSLLAAASAPVAAADGAALYATHCAACHQADGGGTVGLAPPLRGEHWVRLAAQRGYLAAVLLNGLSGPIKLGTQTFVGSMPGFAAQLDDDALAAIATQVRRLQGAAAAEPAYGAEEIRAERAKPGSPPQTRQRRVQLLGG